MAIKIIQYPDRIESPCSYYRCNGPLSEMHRLGEIDLITGVWGEDMLYEARKHDIAIFQRPMSYRCLDQIAVMKDAGVKIWFDLDDHSHGIFPAHPAYELWSKEFNENVFNKIMLLADIVTVSTKYLQDYYLTFNNDVRVIPNALNDYWLEISNFSGNKTVVIRGGSHHWHDLWVYRNEIAEVMNKFEWDLVVIGGEVKFFEGVIDSYSYIPNMGIHEYFGYLMRKKPSVIISPLADEVLNRGKSEVCWIEATMCGGVSLVPEFLNISSDCACNYKNDFARKFSKLLNSEKYRKQLHANSVQLIKDKYLLSNVNKKRKEIYDTNSNSSVRYYSE